MGAAGAGRPDRLGCAGRRSKLRRTGAVAEPGLTSRVVNGAWRALVAAGTVAVLPNREGFVKAPKPRRCPGADLSLWTVGGD
jgi:hypothetical protein